MDFHDAENRQHPCPMIMLNFPRMPVCGLGALGKMKFLEQFHIGRVQYARLRFDGRPEFPTLEFAPETAWNLFASPRTGCGEIPFGGVRQESSRVKKVH
ncbi:hypothetical protein TNCV_2357161 [Trichonephila clavipes]|nr:hypothetical protein TNCV_2357161 [Trichonephila clavipes]